jgi:transposase-like protein
MAELKDDSDARQHQNIDSDLPPTNTQRWTPRRKASVVRAVRTGVLSFTEACSRYQLSAEELTAWQDAVESHGTPGLRVTRLQIYRDPLPARRGRAAPRRRAATNPRSG